MIQWERLRESAWVVGLETMRLRVELWGFWGPDQWCAAVDANASDPEPLAIEQHPSKEAAQTAAIRMAIELLRADLHALGAAPEPKN